jgi:hypothetical protein
LALGKEVTRRESVLAALQQKLAEVRAPLVLAFLFMQTHIFPIS